MASLIFINIPISLIITVLAVWGWTPALAADRWEQSGYVGTDICANCHAEEYHLFITYSKKSKSFQSIERLKKGLSPEEINRCYACHTTGYGKPGGFVSPTLTPKLKNAGCEVCHGPGALHAKTGKPNHIKRHLTKADCDLCHTSERVAAFRFKPLIHGGGH